MERRAKGSFRRSKGKDFGTGKPKGRVSLDNDSSIFEQIKRIARRDARAEIGELQARVFLTNWWCSRYNRPLKDKLLQEYTTEELMYEYCLFEEVAIYRNELVKAETDRIEEERYDDDIEWAQRMEEEELAAEQAAAAEQQAGGTEPTPAIEDPLNDPAQIAWMEEQIKQNKLMFGEDFGEDIKLDLGE